MNDMPKEKRLRILHDDQAKEGELIIHQTLKDELDIKTKAEIVVAKRRFVFSVKARKTVPENKILGNPEDLLAKGIQDNSIATIRAPLD
jgi:RNase P/RNase MRP subunit p29